MSLEYDRYLKKHIANVKKAYEWIITIVDRHILVDILPDFDPKVALLYITNHDLSKMLSDEYIVYDNYFYNGGNKTEEGREAFNKAFLTHVHRNPHHWQYWVAIDSEDDEVSGPQAFDIPDNYVIEMICDWWSFSWSKACDDNYTLVRPKELLEILVWYESHKDKIIFTESTKQRVEALLSVIKHEVKKLYLHSL